MHEPQRKLPRHVPNPQHRMADWAWSRRSAGRKGSDARLGALPADQQGEPFLSEIGQNQGRDDRAWLRHPEPRHVNGTRGRRVAAGR